MGNELAKENGAPANVLVMQVEHGGSGAYDQVELLFHFLKTYEVNLSGLRLIMQLANHEDGCRKLKVLADRIGLTTGAITSVVDKLEHSGLVVRVPERGDRRAISLGLTQHGRGFVKSVSGIFGKR
jgi:DNA-binding MarR family transcriptional regulator